MNSCIKVPLRSVVKDDTTIARINAIVGPVNRLVAQTYTILRLFVAWKLDENLDVPPITESLIRCAMSCLTVESVRSRTEQLQRTEMLNQTPEAMRHYFEKPTNTRQILTLERNKMVTCLKVAITDFFIPTRRCFMNRTLKRGKFVNYYHFIST
jgi:hypothetical protein